MSSKNFGLSGIGDDVQFGKGGKRIKSGTNTVEVFDADGTTPSRVKGASAVDNDDFTTLDQVAQDGFQLEIGDPNTGDGDGNLDDGAIPIDPTDSVSTTIDRLNEVLGLLVPTPPTDFPSGNITQNGYTGGQSPLLADGVIPDNTNGGTLPVTSAGSSVTAYRGTGSNVTSNTLQDNGPGNTGTITAFTNTVAGGSLTFTTSLGDTVNTGGLLVNDNKDFPEATPGFWQSFDARINNATATDGWNRYSITHDAGGSTNDLYILKDTMTATPVVAGGSVAQNTLGTTALSSGITHYGTGATLDISGITMTNIAGLTYTSNSPLQVDDVNGGEDGLLSGVKSFSYANVGIATPVPINTTSAQALNTVTVPLDQNNAHGIGAVKYRGRNVNGNSSYVTIGSPLVLHKAGTTSRIDEQSLNTLGTGARIDLGLGNAPGDTPTVALPGAPTAWDSSQDLSAGGYLAEAAVVGGILSRDLTNYGTGYLPASNPDYSGKEADQYFDLSFAETAKSGFNINITGNYSGLWVGLAGISDDGAQSPQALGGTWWDAFALYNGAGLPGRSGDATAGCANGAPASGSTGTVAITFGTGSSTNATNNRMFVRIKLSAGQSISGITIS